MTIREPALPRPTSAFLTELDRAAGAALLEHDRTLLVLRTVGALAIAGREGDLDAAHEPPGRWLFYRQHHRASEQHHAAIDELRAVTGWYRAAAEMVLRNVVTARPVPSASVLAGLNPGTPNVEQRDCSLPDLDLMLSGNPVVDGKLRAAHDALRDGRARGVHPEPVQWQLWARAVATEATRFAEMAGLAPGEMYWSID